MISPTGKPIRDFDAWGRGTYGAPRGKRIHRGVDFICEAGQQVICPIGGLNGDVIVVREARPYTEGEYSGVLLKTVGIVIKMFYLEPDRSLIGQTIKQGHIIGHAQDISEKYEGMIPHVHLEIVGMNPEVLLNLP